MTAHNPTNQPLHADSPERAVFDSSDTLAAVRAARDSILRNIEEAGGLQALRRQRAAQAKSAIAGANRFSYPEFPDN